MEKNNQINRRNFNNTQEGTGLQVQMQKLQDNLSKEDIAYLRSGIAKLLEERIEAKSRRKHKKAQNVVFWIFAFFIVITILVFVFAVDGPIYHKLCGKPEMSMRVEKILELLEEVDAYLRRNLRPRYK